MVGVSSGVPGKGPKNFKFFLKKVFCFDSVCSRRRGIRKWWAWAPGAAGKGPKKFLKNFFKQKMFLERVCSRRREFENGGREPGGPGKGPPQKFWKIFEFFWKSIYEMCDENISKRREWLSKNGERNEIETSGKIRGYVAGEGEFENRGRESLGPEILTWWVGAAVEIGIFCLQCW